MNKVDILKGIATVVKQQKSLPKSNLTHSMHTHTHTILTAIFHVNIGYSVAPHNNLTREFGTKFNWWDTFPGANQQKHTGLTFTASITTRE